MNFGVSGDRAVTEWARSYFQRRRYVVEGAGLDKARTIEWIVKVDGRTVANLVAREPGIVSIVSKPGEQGFEVDLVELRAFRYPDQTPLSEDAASEVEEWQFKALDL
jgi:hypothetical protein